MTEEINDTTRVLRAVQTLIDKHLYFPTDEDRDAVVVWTAAQWVVSSFQAFGRLYFQSNEPGSGKSEAMFTVSRLSREEVVLVNATPAVIYRVINKFAQPPTLALDEADMIWGKAGSASAKQELLAVVNNGYKSNGYVWKPRGTDDVDKFPCYAPVTLAGLGTLPDALFTRCITIPMQKKPSDVRLVPYNENKHLPLFEGVKSQLDQWSQKIRPDLQSLDPELPPSVEGRLAEIWTGLVAVADLADADDWSVRIRKALKVIGSRKKKDTKTESLDGRFLKVVSEMFQDADRIFTKDVAEELGVTSNAIGKVSRGYDVAPRQMRIGDKSGVGIQKSDFAGVLELLGKE